MRSWTQPNPQQTYVHTTPFRQLEAEALARMTPDEPTQFDAALCAAERRLRRAEVAYGKLGQPFA